MPFINTGGGGGGGGTVENLTPGGSASSFSTSSPFTEAKIWIGGVLQYPGSQAGITITMQESLKIGFTTPVPIDGTINDVIIEYK